MVEEIQNFIEEERRRIKQDEEWQYGYDPNDYARLNYILGEADMLGRLAEHFGIGE
ncbi:hypothetical protein ABZX93_05940 [Streptomyces sp. NPDC006632]|uniref:hypothetical protein n=1 Tax=Streptomyces sp. NPDC006632 TaxID=3157182 RepID=UPI0033A154AB